MTRNCSNSKLPSTEPDDRTTGVLIVQRCLLRYPRTERVHLQIQVRPVPLQPQPQHRPLEWVSWSSRAAHRTCRPLG
ncbi:unnamed protein product [Pleuronectes platessa]|uniref:Uncharacterized protein n=1 Tax=Pleuronectes platessa TaxID=8262 RepID=A0A9N7VVR7_PLEPL|nr:unnamed protein product [Pleuronectes platessa]